MSIASRWQPASTSPPVRNRACWTGSDWYDGPSDGLQAISSPASQPASQPASHRTGRSVYCKGYVDERLGSLVLTLGGRLMSDVVNDIRACGSTDSGTAYNTWGPTPSAHPQLASTRFPEGATMEYRWQPAHGRAHQRHHGGR